MISTRVLQMAQCLPHLAAHFADGVSQQQRVQFAAQC